MNKHVALSSILTLIGSIIYLLLAALFFTVGMITPIHITINDYETSAYLWEFAKYPGPLSLWVAFILVFLIFGIVGIVFSRKVKKKATTLQGVLLILFGFFTLLFVAGILYFIAGIQTLLARDNGNRNEITM